MLMEPPSNSIVESFGIHYSLGIYTRVVAPFLEVSYADFVDGLNQKLASTATLSTYSWEYQVCSEFGMYLLVNFFLVENIVFADRLKQSRGFPQWQHGTLNQFDTRFYKHRIPDCLVRRKVRQ